MMLPIEKVTQEEFEKFKSEHLDGLLLDSTDLKKIGRAFAFERKDALSVSCDDYHVHRYRCLSFKNPIIGVVYRLVDEIRTYRAMVKDLRKTMQKNHVELPERMKLYE